MRRSNVVPEYTMLPKETVLCNFIKNNNIKISRDLAKQIISYIVLDLLDKKRYRDALLLLRKAEKKGLLDNRLRALKNKMEIIAKLESVVEDTVSTIKELIEYMNDTNSINLVLLNKLKKDINMLQIAIDNARANGFSVDNSILNYARDIYNIINTIKDTYPLIGKAKQLLTTVKGYIASYLSNVGTIDGLAVELKGLGTYAQDIQNVMSGLRNAANKLKGININTEEAKTLKQQILAQIESLLTVMNVLNIIVSNSDILGLWLEKMQEFIRSPYENPSSSPFGSAKNQFINIVANMLKKSLEMKDYLNRIGDSSNVDEAFRDVVEAFRRFGIGLSDTIINIIKSMKYFTTFNDYRWNELWEAAEQRAGVNLGTISKSDIQKYEYVCDENGCGLRKREGVVGWLAEHAPEEIVSFWTTAEDALRNIEMYNRWFLHANIPPFFRDLQYMGYIGASIITAVGSLAAPRMLSEQLNALKNLAEEWYDALKERDRRKIDEVARETWNMFFGSPEAVLNTIAMGLLALAAAGWMKKGLPKDAKIPLSRAILGNLIQGDLVGALLVVLERTLPLARLSGIVRTVLETGAIKASQLFDDAGIISRALKNAEKASRIKTLFGMKKMHDIISKSLKNADNLKMIHQNMEKIIKEIGIEELANKIAEYKAAKTLVLTNIESMNLHLPSFSDKIKKSLKKIMKKDVTTSDIPKPILEKLEKVKPLEDLDAEATALSSQRSRSLVQKLASKKILNEESIKTLNKLDNIISELEKQGKHGLVEAIKRFRTNYEKLATEVGYLSDIIKTLDELEKIKQLGQKIGAWKEVVELNRRKKTPGRGWLKKEKININQYLEEFRYKVMEKYLKRKKLKEIMNKQIKTLGEKLSKTEEIKIESFIRSLSEDFRKAGLDDLASELEKVLKGEKKVGESWPLSYRIGNVLTNFADRIAIKISKMKMKAREMISDVEARQVAEDVKRMLPLPEIDKALMLRLGKMYLAGLRVAEKIASEIRRIGEILENVGLKRAESGLVNKLADIIEREYREATYDNLAFLKGLKKGLEAYEKTPIGTLLSELDRAVTRAIRAIEKPLSGGAIANIRLRELARERLAKLLSKDGSIYKILLQIELKLDKNIGEKIRQQLEVTPNSKETLEKAVRLYETTGMTIGEILQETKRFAKEKGYNLPEKFWRALEDYLELRKAVKELKTLRDLAMREGFLTLDKVQKAIDTLAGIDLELAWKSDWVLIKSYLEELMGELMKTKELARKIGAIDVIKNIEETEKTIKQVIQKEVPEGPFAKLTKETEIPKQYSELVSTLEQLYDLLAQGLGEKKVKNLRSLLDEFEVKLEKGVFDESLLRKMKWELRKTKFRNIHKFLRAGIDRLSLKLREVATRIRKGEKATAIEKAINELADEIQQVVKQRPELEKGWVSIEDIVEVSRLKPLRITKDLAERVARILSEREKVIEIRTREGHTVKMKRKIDIKPHGIMHIQYEFEFPGKRIVRYDEVVTVDKNGRAYTFREFFHDPEIEKAVLAYEMAKQGLREMDDLAKLGRDIEDVLSRDLSTIDPDYNILSKIVVVEGDLIRPLLTELRFAGRDLLKKMLKPLLPATSILGKFGMIDLQQEGQLIEKIPLDIYRDIERAFNKLLFKLATPQDRLLLTLTKPIAVNLAHLYQNLVDADLVLSPYIAQQIREKIGEISGASILDPSDYRLKIEWPDERPFDYEKVYIVEPKPDPNIFFVWRKPDVIVDIPTYVGEIPVPGFKIDNNLILILPPFMIDLPKTFQTELTKSMKQTIQERSVQYKPVDSVPSPSGATATPPPVLPPIPILPWLGGRSMGHGSRERERLNII